MKKISIIMIIVLGIYVFSNVKADEFIIPDEAIRLRVLANSNSIHDQDIKRKVSNNVQKSMYGLLKDTKGIADARNKISSNIKIIDNNINELLNNENYKEGYKIDFNYNYFPEKTYKGVVYKEGYYESVKVTLGSGEGDNWWCVLFPPLCLIEAEEAEEVEYKFFLKELLDKYL